jgi:hypothetical protein
MGRKAVSFLFYGISVVLTGLLLVAAVLCRYASSVSPGEGGFWATLALLMPVVLLANVVALVWWAVRRKWIVLLMPLVALVLNLGYISAMVQLPDFKERGNPHDIRIATLNVNGFRRLESTPATARAIAGMVNREQVDVLCLQEFMDSREFPADSIGKVFARRMPYFLHAVRPWPAVIPFSIINTSGLLIRTTTTCVPTCSSAMIRCVSSPSTSRLRASPSSGAGSGKITTATHPSSEYWASWNTTVVSVPGR